jgi:ribonuclease D
MLKMDFKKQGDIARIIAPDYVPELFSMLATCLKEANKLPSEGDFQHFLQFDEFERRLSSQRKQAQHLVKKFAKVCERETVDFIQITKIVNNCLRKVEDGLASFQQPPAESNGNDIPKPQFAFNDLIDNSDRPFVLDACEPGKADTMYSFLNRTVDPGKTHPYMSSINGLQLIQYKGLLVNLKGNNSTLNYKTVDSTDKFEKMKIEIKDCSVIAVDVKTHEKRSYQGFSCILVIVANETVYVIDALKLRQEITKLSFILSNPGVLKVVHNCGAVNAALQRDFKICVVNAFDTMIASQQLAYPSSSAAFLLKTFKNLTLDREGSFDWRKRPLALNMIKSSSLVCSSLFSIAYYQVKELELNSTIHNMVKDSALNAVFQSCKEISSILYRKPCSTLKISSLNPTQKSVLDFLQKWRERVAKLEDESLGYVCNDEDLISISSTLPDNLSQLTSCSKSSFISKHSEYLLQKISSIKSGPISPSLPSKIDFSIENISQMFDTAGWKASSSLPFKQEYESLLARENFDMSMFDYGSLQPASSKQTHINHKLLLTIRNQSGVNYINVYERSGYMKSPREEDSEEKDSASNLNEILSCMKYDENLIPNNIEEIYAISNKNRKKNKAKLKQVADNEPDSPTHVSMPLEDLKSFLNTVLWSPEQPEMRRKNSIKKPSNVPRRVI